MLDTVHDNPGLGRFELTVDGHTAISAYRHTPGTVTFTHTEVPDALSGRGVGSALAKGALDAVRMRGEKIVPLCPFIAAYIRKHPEYRDLLADQSWA